MIVEKLPEVLALSTAEKEVLAEELLQLVALELERDPALSTLLQTRLAEHDADPDSGVKWEELRDRLLKNSRA